MFLGNDAIGTQKYWRCIYPHMQTSKQPYLRAHTYYQDTFSPNPSQENLNSRLKSRWTQGAESCSSPFQQKVFIELRVHCTCTSCVTHFPILQSAIFDSPTYCFPLLPMKNPCWHFHHGLPVVSSTDSPRMGHMTTKLPGYMPDMSKLVTAMNLNLATLSCILQIEMVKKVGCFL